jgi:CheY-like chemotaxis protein
LEGSEIQLSVKDNGLGIKPDDLSKLFKEFSKITDEKNLLLNSQGVGLGLLISNRIAHQLNEKNCGIHVESELAKGSVFSFKITDFLNEENKYLMTASNHKIDHIFRMECRFINNEQSQHNENESIMVLPRKNSFSTLNDNTIIYERINNRNLSGSIGNNTSKSSKIMFGVSSSISSKNHSKCLFFFSEAGTFKNFVSHDDFKSRELLIDRKKEFIIQNMRRKCRCPYVLAIDDNDFNNLTMAMHAKSLEIPILTALSVSEALEKINEQMKNTCCNFFKLIFLDIEMPIIDGIEGFLIIKKFYEEKQQKPFVIAITGHTEGSEKMELVKKIIGHTLVKPISFESLVIFIEKFIKDLF